MDRSRQIIRLHIEGSWSAEQMGQMFVCLSDLYNLRFILQVLYEERLEWEHFYLDGFRFSQLSRARLRLHPRWASPFPLSMLEDLQRGHLTEFLALDELLEVRRVRYASPGISDLAGIGTIVGHVKEFVLALIDRHDRKRERQLAVEEKEAEIEAKRMENAKNLVSLAKEIGCSSTEVRRLVAHVDEKQEMLIQLIDQKKLVFVSDGETPDES